MTLSAHPVRPACLRQVPTLTVLALALIASSPALAATFTPTSTIRAVTVHPGLATITRELQQSLPAGAHTLLLSDLPSGLDEASLQVSGQGAGLKIGALEVRHVQAGELVQPEAKALEQQLQQVRDLLAQLQAEAAALTTQEQFLQALAASPAQGGKEGKLLPPGDWGAASQALGQEMREVGLARVKLTQAQRQQEAEASRLARELQRLRSAVRESRTVAIALESRGGEAKLTLQYQIAGASWQPIYEAALDTRTKQLSLTRAALVQQATGENWPQVALTLATSRPHQASQAPEPQSWWIDLHDDSQELQKAALAGGANMARKEMAMLAAPAPAPEAQADAAEPEQALLVSGDFVAEYQIPGAVSVNSNQDKQRVVLALQQLPATLRLQSTPRLDPHAYLYADVKNSLPAPWLAGEWRLSRDGAFIATRYEPQLAAGDQLALAFGVDDGVKVTVSQLTDEAGESGVINKQQTLTRRWSYRLQSSHDQALPLTLLDSWPVSRNEQIKVQALDDSPKPTRHQYEDRPGVLAWDLTLPAKGELLLKPGYRIEFPYQRRLEGL